MGFLHPDSGEARILGMDCFRQAAEIQKHMGYQAGRSPFPTACGEKSSLRFQAGMKGRKDLGRAKELSERFELDLTGRISKMSKGDQQKLGLSAPSCRTRSSCCWTNPPAGWTP